MNITFYGIQSSDPTLQATADGVLGLAPMFDNNANLNESLIYRMVTSGKIANPKFAIWRVGPASDPVARLQLDGHDSKLLKNGQALTYLQTDSSTNWDLTVDKVWIEN